VGVQEVIWDKGGNEQVDIFSERKLTLYCAPVHLVW